MSLVLSIFAFVGINALVCVFWYAMIESQEDIPGVNEPGSRRKGEKK